jgi:hypothetical protein
MAQQMPGDPGGRGIEDGRQEQRGQQLRIRLQPRQAGQEGRRQAGGEEQERRRQAEQPRQREQRSEQGEEQGDELQGLMAGASARKAGRAVAPVPAAGP